MQRRCGLSNASQSERLAQADISLVQFSNPKTRMSRIGPWTTLTRTMRASIGVTLHAKPIRTESIANRDNRTHPPRAEGGVR